MTARLENRMAIKGDAALSCVPDLHHMLQVVLMISDTAKIVEHNLQQNVLEKIPW